MIADDRLDEIEERLRDPMVTYKENVTEDAPALVAGYRKVLDLHRPNQIGSHITCMKCRDIYGTQVGYPCETVAAITTALGGAS